MYYNYNLGKLFYEISKQYSRKTALKYPDGTLIKYSHLNQLSNQLAQFLVQKGFQKNQVIAIFNEKSYFGYALMLACLKFGIIYTNLDVTSPWARVKKILEVCKPAAVFFDNTGNEIFKEFDGSFPSTVSFDLADIGFQKEIFAQDAHDLEIVDLVIGSDPAYIMFTSGSTGFPKGAVMSHNNVLNFIQWGHQTFNVKPDDVFTNANPIYFDNSVFDFYTSLFSGATLVPIKSDLLKSANDLVKAINDSGCTIWFSVPSLLVYLLTTKALTKNDFKNIKQIAFGGEGFPKNKLKQLYDLFKDRITLLNVYGPTECTCICSMHEISESDFENMNELATLGHIAPNFGYEIIPFDTENQHFGELALIGPCVGLGYYNDIEKTEKSFVQNPKKKFRNIMYKTGDVVEEAKNGDLHFRGRVDNQIKHMGYRIELEEIEAAFNSLIYINEVGVIYQMVNTELGQIKAFVSINENIKKESIVLDLKNLLPPYMVPRIIEVLDSIPKNANGKIDRKQLALL
ncbi:MAG TPA: AMP-binding protein [Puia sp.]|nr:AMP-binding protein [Puia sp.]